MSNIISITDVSGYLVTAITTLVGTVTFMFWQNQKKEEAIKAIFQSIIVSKDNLILEIKKEHIIEKNELKKDKELLENDYRARLIFLQEKNAKYEADQQKTNVNFQESLNLMIEALDNKIKNS